MSAVDFWLGRHREIAAGLAGAKLPWLARVRDEAIGRFADEGWPTTRRDRRPTTLASWKQLALSVHERSDRSHPRPPCELAAPQRKRAPKRIRHEPPAAKSETGRSAASGGSRERSCSSPTSNPLGLRRASAGLGVVVDGHFGGAVSIGRPFVGAIAHRAEATSSIDAACRRARP
jgi:hypothetical protein